MSTIEQQEFDELAEIGIGPVESGVPLPRAGGFLGRLRRTLERLEVGMSVVLENVTYKQERYIRARLPDLGKGLEAKYSVRVVDHKRDRTVKRSLRIHRLE